MTSKEIYKGTKKFPARLLLLNIFCAVASIVIGGLLAGVGLLVKSEGMVIGGLVVGVIIYITSAAIVQHYIGYMFKYGAVYAIAKSHANGYISKTYFNDSVEYIKTGFLKANAYFVLDRLVSGAVRGVTKLANFVLGFLPDNLKNIINTFIDIYLNYIDECCLGWSMIHPEDNVVKSSCDGVVIYYQNAKDLLKPAFMTSIRVLLTRFIILVSGCFFIFFPPLTMAWWVLVFAVVSPYLEHRVLCNTMVAYLDLADNTEIRTDLYAKLNKCRPFQKLRSKMEDPTFDVAPGNENINAHIMRKASEEVQCEDGAAESFTDTSVSFNDTSVTFKETAETFRDAALKKAAEVTSKANDFMSQRAVPVMNQNAVIPEPPRDEPTPEQVMWQKAWDRMTPDQKRQYSSMDSTRQRAWKAQILKALFNYDLK